MSEISDLKAIKGRGKWLLRFVSPITGKRRDMGLGAYPDVGISAARIAALTAKEAISKGRDPVEERSAVKTLQKAEFEALTFKAAATQVHEELKPGFFFYYTNVFNCNERKGNSENNKKVSLKLN